MKNNLILPKIKEVEELKPIPFEKLEKITTNLNGSSPNDLVIYKLNNSENAEKLFHQRIQESLSNWIITNRKTKIPVTSKNIIVIDENWNEKCQLLADYFYPLHSGIKFVGITGTNGKTTTVELFRQLMKQANLHCISIGTLGVRGEAGTIEDFGMTSPGYIELRRMIYQHSVPNGVVAMEVSSHALDQERIWGIKLDVAGWTSFSQDHLDYHQTLEAYFDAKMKIFTFLKSESNLLVPQSQHLLIEKIRNKINRVDAVKLNQIPEGIFFQSHYNQENLAVALEAARRISSGKEFYIKNLLPPPGRMNFIQEKNKIVVIDFAHTPDAIENICFEMKKSFPDKELIILFGCGGNRDKSKRSLMGKAAEKYCQHLWLTSDNPRFENPDEIIQDIVLGIKDRSKMTIIVERDKAIQSAIRELKPSEILIVAGKGHENYIESKGIKKDYSDKEEVQKALSVLKT
jgi:UDP-N-acetylmuramoyl-L-alanyl-D-glutamate--2,6-diaminopimelate ligase